MSLRSNINKFLCPFYYIRYNTDSGFLYELETLILSQILILKVLEFPLQTIIIKNMYVCYIQSIAEIFGHHRSFEFYVLYSK